jgi:hypothetical protein
MLPNPFFEIGSFVEDNDGVVQEVTMHQQNGRFVPGAYKGLAIQTHLVRKYLLKILSRGLDTEGAFAEIRGRYKETSSPTNTFWENYCEETGEDPRANS